jgi:hypothetical protein
MITNDYNNSRELTIKNNHNNSEISLDHHKINSLTPRLINKEKYLENFNNSNSNNHNNNNNNSNYGNNNNNSNNNNKKKINLNQNLLLFHK